MKAIDYEAFLKKSILAMTNALLEGDFDAARRIKEFIEVLEKEEKIDAEVVRHGRWTECWHDERLYSGICSECEEASVRSVRAEPLPICHKCGARMDGCTVQ